MRDYCNSRGHSTISCAARTLVLTFGLALLGTGSLLAQFGETTQYFPHFVLGGGWTTIFTIHNPSTSAITVQLQMYNNDGSTFFSGDVALSPGGTQSVSIPSPAVLTTGWTRLTSDDPFSGTMLFKFLDSGGQLISEVGVLPSTTSDQLKIFGTVDNETGSNTGIAVANPSATSNSVLTVQRFNSAGLLQDIRTVILGPQQQLARFLTEDPYFVGLNNFDGIVEVSATQPITAVTLLLEGSEIAAVGVITPQRVLEGVVVNTASPFNTGVGSQALGSNTTGFENTAIGYQSLFSNADGFFNTASGHQALLASTTGSRNTAIGYQSLITNTDGHINTAIGTQSLLSNTTGNDNTAIGYRSLFSNSTGSRNTALGNHAGVSSGNLSNATAIGYNAKVDASNKVRIGNASVSVIESQVGLTVVSDRNAKERFQPLEAEDVLMKVTRIPVTSWNYIGHDPAQFRHYGPMAQDFFAAFGHDGVGTVGSETTISSSDLSGILMLAVQALEKRTTDLKSENAKLKALLESSERSNTEDLH